MSKPIPSYKDIREIKIIEVIKVVRGVGKGEQSMPYRFIDEYYDPKSGKLLARTDSMAQYNPMTIQDEKEFK